VDRYPTLQQDKDVIGRRADLEQTIAGMEINLRACRTEPGKRAVAQRH